MKTSTLIPLIAILSTMAGCAAAQQLKPGLWEVRQSIAGDPELDRQMADARKQMAALPPAQRQQAEAMMARQGMKMTADGTISRMCVTKASADSVPIQPDCKVTSKTRSGNTAKVAFTCANPPSSGVSEMTYNGGEAFTMKSVIERSSNGKPQKLTTQGSGKWLQADCAGSSGILRAQ